MSNYFTVNGKSLLIAVPVTVFVVLVLLVCCCCCCCCKGKKCRGCGKCIRNIFCCCCCCCDENRSSSSGQYVQICQTWRELNVRELGITQSIALWICEFHQSYFLTNWTLEIYRELVSVCKLLFSLAKKKWWDIMLSWCVAITKFCTICFKALTHRIDSVSNSRFKCVDVPRIIIPFNYNF